MASNKWRYCWVGLSLFCACEQLAIYERIITLINCRWPVAKVLSFLFQIKDTAPTHNIFLLVSNTRDYPYQNLYPICYLGYDTENLTHQALKNYPLFDMKTGKPLGSGFWQSQKHALSMINDHQFSHPGLYTLKLEHFMRTDILPPGLKAVGIKVISSKQHTQ